MSKCKDCLHFEVCKSYVDTVDFDVDDGVCLHFEKQVVRCRDCIHMKEQFNARFCDVWCMYNGMGDDGFCNYGEREDNG